MKNISFSIDFNILYPEYLGLLKFIKESGDYLIVDVNRDNLSNKFQIKDTIYE